MMTKKRAGLTASGDVTDRSGHLDRRRFLQTALGSGMVAAGVAGLARPTSARGAMGSSAPSAGIADAFQGVVVGVQGRSVTVNMGAPNGPEVLRTADLTPASSVWNKGVIGADAPDIGDVFLVRSVIPGQIERAWINLVSFDADFTQQSASALQVSGGHPWNGAPIQIDVTTPTDTNWYDNIQRRAGKPNTAIAGGHIVGYREGDSVVATAVGFVTVPDAEAIEASLSPTQPAEVIQVAPTPDAISYCIMAWTGNASMFNCPTGAGYCGTCNTGLAYQAAWPRTLGVQNCDNGCTSQCALKCGDSFLFYNCNKNAMWLTKVDTGPCQLSGPGCSCSPAVCHYSCGGDPCGVSANTPRVVDLTAPTMAAVAPGGYMCSSCTVAITCSCSGCTCPY